MTRTMLKELNTQTDFWVDIVATTFYILYRSPTRALDQSTPYKALTRSKPKVGHLWVFGCLAVAIIDSQMRKQVDSKSQRMIFIGYCENSKTYKIFDLYTKKVRVNRDMHFFKNKGWDWLKSDDSDAQNFMSNADMEEDSNGE